MAVNFPQYCTEIEHILANLFAPYNLTRPLLLVQIDELTESLFGGDVSQFFEAYLLYLKPLLQYVRFEALSAIKSCGLEQTNVQEGWPLVYQGKLVVNLISLPDELLIQPGDFFVYASLVTDNELKLFIKYFDGHKISRNEIDDCVIDDIFSGHETPCGFKLKTCLVSGKEEVERIHWNEILAGEEHITDICANKSLKNSTSSSSLVNFVDVYSHLLESGICRLTDGKDEGGLPIVECLNTSQLSNSCLVKSEHVTRLLSYYLSSTRAEALVVVVNATHSIIPESLINGCLSSQNIARLHILCDTSTFHECKSRYKTTYVHLNQEALHAIISSSQLTEEFGGNLLYSHDVSLQKCLSVELFVERQHSLINLIKKQLNLIYGLSEKQLKKDLSSIQSAYSVLSSFEDCSISDELEDVKQQFEDEFSKRISEIEIEKRQQRSAADARRILKWIDKEATAMLSSLNFNDSLIHVEQNLEKIAYRVECYFDRIPDILDDFTEFDIPGKDNLEFSVSSVRKLVEEKRRVLISLQSIQRQIDAALEWALAAVHWLAGMDLTKMHNEAGCHSLIRSLNRFRYKWPEPGAIEYPSSEYSSLQKQVNFARNRCVETSRLLDKRHDALVNSIELFKSSNNKRRASCFQIGVSPYRNSILDNDDLMDNRCSEFIVNDSDSSCNLPILSEAQSNSSITSESECGSTLSLGSNQKQNSNTQSIESSTHSSESASVSCFDSVSYISTANSESSARPPFAKYHSFPTNAALRTSNSDSSLPALFDSFKDDQPNGQYELNPNVVYRMDKPQPSKRPLRSDSPCFLKEESSPQNNKRLWHIMQEIVQTERDYISSLEYIVINYIPEVERLDVPQALRGKKNIVFGGIERLYNFHAHYFLKELDSCVSEPLSVGRAFLKHEDSLYMYALYNQNKPKSDVIMAECGNAFFADKQIKLADKMNLASYLLKPTQRLAKYCLLLQDVVRGASFNSLYYNDLKKALDVVKFLLSHGNDLLALECLKDCDINIKDYGRLLKQEEFLVWQGRKKFMRHIFLFEELIVFSKTKKSRKGNDFYQYKNSFKMQDVGLTEKIGESGLKFEIWLRRYKPGESYIIQAPSVTICIAWVSVIAQRLWNQILRCKNLHLSTQTFVATSKQYMDLEPSENQIQARSLNIQVRSKSRASIAGPAHDFTNKRPHSVISMSSGSSSAASSISFNSGHD